ncbi:hypothetical protein CHS0354_040033 [Potamilus streckersoni]|uniref:Cadherin domain-containing protein n=1 Tax=Potamilus streckersoni TaxID=2493646 RepID=A0AAE0W253_9BIVA|nr:hypothetical protein CHS0354_040033 [Potamilus streckersoni]
MHLMAWVSFHMRILHSFSFQILVAVILLTLRCHGYPICDIGSIGISGLSGNSNPRNRINAGFLMDNSSFKFNCCGVVTNYTFVAADNSNTSFQVWRPTTSGSSVYKLVGTNKLDVKNGNNKFSIAAADQITVIPNDVMGWWGQVEVITSRLSSLGNKYQNNTSDSAIGATKDWSSAFTEINTGYELIVNYGPNTLPYFTNLAGASTTVNYINPAGTVVYTVGANDTNRDDASKLTVSMATNPYFTFDNSTLQVKILNMSGVVSPVTLNFTVVDICSQSATGTLTVNITYSPINITNLPSTQNISETTTVGTLLYQISTTTTTLTVNCSLLTTNVPFQVKKIPSSSAWGLYINSSLDYDATNAYTLNVSCTDGLNTPTGKFTANIIKNVPPSFTNLDSTTNLSTALNTGASVYNVSATDPEGFTLFFNMTCNPSLCPFTMASSGQITLNAALDGHTTPKYTLYVMVSDGYDVTEPRVLNVTIFETIPYFTNLPASISINEATALNTVLYTISCIDDNPDDNLTVSMTTNPFNFAFDASTKSIKVASTLSNAIGTNLLVFKVTDGHSQTSTGTFTVTIINVAPVINNLPASKAIIETTYNETLLHTMNVTDTSTSITCSMTTTSVPFLVKQIPSTTTWGIYVQSNPSFKYSLRNNYSLYILCSDGWNATTGIFTVNITENKPPTFTNLVSTTVVSLTTAFNTGNVVYTVSASDNENDTLSFNFTCNRMTCPFSYSSSTGKISLSQNLDGHNISTYAIYAYVFDGCSLVGPAVLNVTIAETVPYFNNLPAATTISEQTAVGNTLYTVNFTDDNPEDVLTVTMMTSTPYFTFDSTSRGIKVDSVLSGALGNNILVFKVSDPYSQTSTGTFTIIVTNVAPVIHNLPASTTIIETTYNETLLLTINVTDTSTNITCSLSTGVPFVVKQIQNTINWGIYLNNNPGLQYSSVNLYPLTISCTDGWNATTAVFTVNIMENKPPTFTNLGNTTVSLTTAQTTGNVVYIVSATDNENDVLTFNFTCYPTTCPFTMSNSTGVITVSRDLQGYSVPFYAVNVYVFDGRSLVGPTVLNITITETVPFFTNLPANTTINETMAIGQVLYTLSCMDANTKDNLTVTMTTSTSFFTFDANSKEIKVVSSLPGAIGNNMLVFKVWDPYSQTSTGTFTIIVSNVAPVLQNLPASTSIIETTSTETLLHTINVTDMSTLITCNLTKTDVPFIVKLVPITTDWGIYLKNNPGLEYNITNVYSLNISCNDGIDADTELMTVNIIENIPPTFTNLDANPTIYLTTAQNDGIVVYSMPATDNENDTLLFNFTCQPSTCPFSINSSSGVIKLSQNLDGHPILFYAVNVYVCDGHSLVGPAALNVNISETIPYFNNLPAGTTINETVAADNALYTLSFKDDNPRDNLTVTMKTNTSYFTLDTNTIRVASSLPGAIGTNVLVFAVSDPYSQTSTGTFIINVTNVAPVIHSLPASTSIIETTYNETLLHAINVTDTSTSITCYMMTANVSFEVKQIPTTGDWGIYVQNTPGLEYSIKNVYFLNISCSDGIDADIGIFTVNITENVPPTFTNLDSTSNVSLTTAQKLTYVIFTVSASDKENDTLYFNFTCNPSPCPFSISHSSGVITVSANLSGHSISSYAVNVYVSDGHTLVGPEVLTVTITETIPYFTNLPNATTINETEVIDNTLYTLMFKDDNPEDVLFVRMTTSTPYFSLDTSTYIVKVASTLPGAIGVTTLLFEVSDAYSKTSTGTFIITVTNMAPVIHSLPASTSIIETTHAETLLHTINVTDTSTSVMCNMTMTYGTFLVKQISNTTHWGIYVQNNPALEYSINNVYFLNISCNDGIDADTEIFTVNITENIPPAFTNLGSITVVSLTTAQNIGDVVYNVSATDNENDTMSFNLTCNSTTCPFSISVTSGMITVSQDLDGHPIRSYTVNVYVSDGHSLVGPAVLNVNITETIPYFTNLPGNTTINETEAVGNSFYTVSFMDDNPADILNITMMTNTPYFTFDSNTRKIKVDSSLPGSIGVNELVFQVSDPYSQTSTGTVTITVSNVAPVIDSLPNSTTIIETTKSEILLHSINVTDTSTNITCSMTTSDVPFLIRKIENSTKWGIYLQNNPGLEASIKSEYNLSILCDDGIAADTGIFTVYIADNIPPTFTNLASNNNASLMTDVNAGYVVYIVSATDTENDTLTFNLTCVPSTCPFIISSSSGLITVSQDLDGHPVPLYAVNIYVFDGRSLVGPAVLNVTITETIPFFTNLPANTTINETEEIDKVLYTLSFMDANPEDNLTVTMTTSSSFFTFNESSKEIKVVTSLPGAIGNNVLVFKVWDPYSQTSTGTFTIMVSNVAPVIQNLPASTSIIETTYTETLLHTINVTDMSTLITCNLTTTGVRFLVKLVPNTTEWGIYLDNNPALEYNIISVYFLNISCNDGIDADTGVMTVNIIENIPPTFKNLGIGPIISLTSAQNSGIVVYNISASDNENDTLLFNFTCQPSACPFSINSSSGVIELSQDLDGHPIRSYAVNVYVCDGHSLVGPAVLNFTITETVPYFNNLPTSMTINETVAVGNAIYTLNFMDDNPDDNLTVMLETNISYFTLDNSTNTIRVASSLSGTIGINVLVFAVSDPYSQTSTGTFIINVTNVAPVIHSLPASTSIIETTYNETLLHTINVTDTSTSITCYMMTVNVSFEVKQIPTTGDWGIYVQNTPDLEYSIQNVYLLNISCSDGIDADIGIFTVNITENIPPTFTKLDSISSVSLTTALKLTEVVYTVSATDKENDALSFNFTCDPSPCPFSISHLSGVITVSANLSGHSTPSYAINLYISDGHSLAGPSVLTVTITETSPYFTNLPNVTTINETEIVGNTLYTLMFKDDNPEDVLFVRMTTSTPYFSLDNSTYIVKVASTLPGAIGVSTLLFEVSDAYSKTSTGTFIVTVTNVAPVIHSLPASTSIIETTYIETLLHIINVTDTSTSVTCNLTTTDVTFLVQQISNTTKWGIYVQNNPVLEYSKKNVYFLNVSCNDGIDADTEIFTVNITENIPPEFTNLGSIANVSLMTAQNIGYVVYNVSVTDNENDTMSFNLTCTPSTCPFSISSTSGVITVSQDLDGHPVRSYAVNVYVSDGHSLVGSAVLNVTITETIPYFTNLPGNVTINETEPVGNSFYTVSFMDDNPADVLNVTMTTNTSYFTFDSDTRKIKVASSLPGSIGVNELVFQVSDPYSQTSTGTFTITVSNVAPVIDSLPNSTTIIETTKSETLLHSVNVIDTSTNITCSMTTPVFPFLIKKIENSTKWGIYLQNNPGLEASINPDYNLSISCDDGIAADTGIFTVYIVDNIPPTFTNLASFNNSYLTTALNAGYIIYIVSATDNENDTLTFNLTCYPSTCPFNISLSSGVITLSQDLDGHPVFAYLVDVYVYDGKTLVGPRVINVTINETIPYFTNLPSNTTIFENETIDNLVYTLNFTDDNPDDILNAILKTSTPYFYFDSNNIRVNSSLARARGTNLLVFEVSDAYFQTSTGTFTVMVTNMVPVIHNLPSSTSLIETTSAKTLLHVINITDVDLALINCSLTSSVVPFLVQQIPSHIDWGIYLQSNPNLEFYRQDYYLLNISCTDGEDIVNGTYIVNITENYPPAFTNLNSSTELSILSDQLSGFLVLALSATDVEGDTLSFNFTCSPSPCPFNISTTSGSILTSEDLDLYFNTRYELAVYVNDGHSLTGPGRLNITIRDSNEPVVINNLPYLTTINVSENTALWTPVFQVNVTDPNVYDSHYFNLTVVPLSGISCFAVGLTDGVIRISSSTCMDYESASYLKYNISITASDRRTSDTQLLQVQIVNINERPVFENNTYFITTTENVSGTLLPNPVPQFNVTDQDVLDANTYSLDCGSLNRYLVISSLTGSITFAADYDLDNNTLLTTSIVCIIVATDNGGLSGTATVSITINYVNEYPPTFPNELYSFTTPNTSAIGRVVCVVQATDADAGPDGVATYSISGNLSEYFRISNTGVITVALSLLHFHEFDVIRLIANATDGGGLSVTAIVFITIGGPEDSVSSSGPYRSFIQDSRNVAWLIASLVVLTAIICVIAALVIRNLRSSSTYRIKNLIRKRQRPNKRITPRSNPRNTPRLPPVHTPVILRYNGPEYQGPATSGQPIARVQVTESHTTANGSFSFWSEGNRA